jgi:ubiquinone/menaquinone biosynthesis C-methylase UbiE
MQLFQGRSNLELASERPVRVPVEEGYERWAATYDAAPNPLLALEERNIAPRLPDLRGIHVLDLACGTGRWLGRLLAKGANLGVGVDFSTAMLSVASQKAAIRGRVTRADCLRLPFGNAVFDFAMCSFVLGHIGDLPGAARELARVMKADANVLVSDLHPDAYARGWRTGFRDAEGAVEIETFPHSVEEITARLRAAGFEFCEISEFNFSDAEKPIFARAGKEHLFGEACCVPAILFCHLRRMSCRAESEERLEGQAACEPARTVRQEDAFRAALNRLSHEGGS